MATEALRIAAGAGVIIAGALIGLAHRMRSDLSGREHALSTYFAGRTRGVMATAYAALTAALAATAGVLDAVDLGGRLACGACALAAILLIPVVASTNREPGVPRSTSVRLVHRYSAAAAFGSIAVAMASSAIDAWPASPLIFSFGVLGAALAVVVLSSRPGQTYGLRQRLLLGAVGAWVLAVAIG